MYLYIAFLCDNLHLAMFFFHSGIVIARTGGVYIPQYYNRNKVHSQCFPASSLFKMGLVDVKVDFDGTIDFTVNISRTIYH